MAGFILTNISLDQSWPRASSQPRIGYHHHQSSLSLGEIEALTLTLGRTSLGTLVTVRSLLCPLLSQDLGQPGPDRDGDGEGGEVAAGGGGDGGGGDDGGRYFPVLAV